MSSLLSKEVILGAAVGAGITCLATFGYQFITNRGNPTRTSAGNELVESNIQDDARMKHYWLVNWLDGQITDDSLESLKIISSSYLNPKTVTKIKSVNDLLTNLEVNGKISVGQYDNLIKIMKDAGIEIGIEAIKMTAKAIQDTIQNGVTSEGQIKMSSLEACSIQPHQADCYDALIMHDNSDETKTMVYEYKTHLERDLQMENVQVELIDDIGIGQTHFNTMENVFDKYRYILIFLTPNFTNDTLNRFEVQMCLMQSLEDPDKQGRVIPVWTAKEKEKTKSYPGELVLFKGLHYWKFYDDSHKTMYLKHMQNIIGMGRKFYL